MAHDHRKVHSTRSNGRNSPHAPRDTTVARGPIGRGSGVKVVSSVRSQRLAGRDRGIRKGTVSSIREVPPRISSVAVLIMPATCNLPTVITFSMSSGSRGGVITEPRIGGDSTRGDFLGTGVVTMPVSSRENGVSG